MTNSKISRHSQLLASLKAWCHWIGKRPEKLREQLCLRAINCCIWSFTCNDQVPPSDYLIHSAAQLFLSLTAILKPCLWERSEFRNLICSNKLPHLKPDTVKVLRRALVNAIILPAGDNVMRQKLLGKQCE